MSREDVFDAMVHWKLLRDAGVKIVTCQRGELDFSNLGLPVLTLAKLIESKIACAEGNVRRAYKDFADVIELILANRLSSAFARYLHKPLRPTFRELVTRARGGE